MTGRPIILALCACSPLFAQQEPAAVASVPFVGCESDGQVGPVEAPSGNSPAMPMTAEAARRLAYYVSAQGIGVLAPRGWYCLGSYGSSGEALYVSPMPIDRAKWFSKDRGGFTGPTIEIDRTYGDTSGRFEVAEMIARVFPKHVRFAKGVIEGDVLPGDSFPVGPYPSDRLTYKSDRIVEYETAANAAGLGTSYWLRKNESPVRGVAVLVGETPNLLYLAVRLPPDLTDLASTIIHEVEREAALNDR